MHLYLGANISQAFWRLVYPRDRKPFISMETEPAARRGECAHNTPDIMSMAPPWLDACKAQGYERVDAIVFDHSQKRSSRTCTTAMWSKALPPGSFCTLPHDVSVSSPCFTFLQMSSQLSFPELVAYGDELCGTYVFDASDPRGMKQREAPLVTIEELARYIDAAKGLPGVKAARRALAHISSGSASPMETLDDMLLCLPYLRGGYTISQPVLNLTIDLDAHAARIAMQRTCRADLCWRDIHYVIEHQGEYDHTGQDSFSSDRARINGLKAQGFTVIEMTSGIVHNLKAFEEIACEIAKRQGKRIPRYALGPTDSRLELRRALFAWNARYGRPA